MTELISLSPSLSLTTPPSGYPNHGFAINLQKINDIDQLLTFISTLPADDSELLLSYLQANHPHFLGAFDLTKNSLKITVEDAKILQRLNFNFYNKQYSDEVFQYLFSLQKDDRSYYFSLKNILMLSFTLDQFKALLFYRNLSVQEKIEGHSFYFYLEPCLDKKTSSFILISIRFKYLRKF